MTGNCYYCGASEDFPTLRLVHTMVYPLKIIYADGTIPGESIISVVSCPDHVKQSQAKWKEANAQTRRGEDQGLGL